LLKLGADVRVAGPPTLIPNDIDKFGVKVYYNITDAVKDADVIMSLRLQKEDTYDSKLPSFNEYKEYFKIDSRIMSYAKPDAIVMHPGSPDRRIEIASGIVDSPQCILDDQITNGVAIRMALLYLLAMGRRD
jgi:aspartate carbamoyltransferase catalytic subunit